MSAITVRALILFLALLPSPAPALTLMHHCAPRGVDGLEFLARLIHPEAFTK